MKLYYLYTLKALWVGQGKIKMYYRMSRVKKQLSGERSFDTRFLNLVVHDLASENHANNFREKFFFHTNEYKYMSLNFATELTICEGNRHVSTCSISNANLFWNYTSRMGAQILVYTKIFLSISISAWKPPPSQFFAIIAFDSHFKSLSNSLSFVNIYKNDMKKLSHFSHQLREDSYVSGIAKHHYST